MFVEVGTVYVMSSETVMMDFLIIALFFWVFNLLMGGYFFYILFFCGGNFFIMMGSKICLIFLALCLVAQVEGFKFSIYQNRDDNPNA